MLPLQKTACQVGQRSLQDGQQQTQPIRRQTCPDAPGWEVEICQIIVEVELCPIIVEVELCPIIVHPPSNLA